MAPTTNDMACTKCRFYDEHMAPQAMVDDDAGLCRYNPPISQPDPQSHGLWPVVGATDWCGHFTPGRAG